jgi:hypothetical protein
MMERAQLHQDSMAALRQYLAAMLVPAIHGCENLEEFCDISSFADDPYCTYHMSKDHDYQKSFWTGPDEKVHSMSVKVLGNFLLFHSCRPETNWL